MRGVLTVSVTRASLQGMAAMNKTVELYRSKPEFGDEKTIAKAEREHKDMTKELEKLAVRF